MSDLYNAPDPVTEAVKYWNWRYENGQTQWHLDDVSPVLSGYYDKLNPLGKAKRVLYAMCGMSVDLDWFAKEKDMEVVGVDIALSALKVIMSRSGQKWTEESVPQLGPDAKLFTRDDGKMKLYYADFLTFNSKIEGRFDAIFDRDGAHTIDRVDIARYAKLIKDLLNSGGRCLMEAIYYDPKILEDPEFRPPMKVPPPFSTDPTEIKNLFEPECTVDHIDHHTYHLLYGRPTDFNTYMIVKE